MFTCHNVTYDPSLISFSPHSNTWIQFLYYNRLFLPSIPTCLSSFSFFFWCEVFYVCPMWQCEAAHSFTSSGRTRALRLSDAVAPPVPLPVLYLTCRTRMEHCVHDLREKTSLLLKPCLNRICVHVSLCVLSDLPIRPSVLNLFMNGLIQILSVLLISCGIVHSSWYR